MKFGKEYYEYSKNVQGFDMMCKGDWQKRYVEYLNDVFSLKGKHVLDFGCALGSIASAMIDFGMDTYGIEIDQWYVDNCPFENLKGKFFSYDGYNLPVATEHFDFVHASQTMEHIDRNVLPTIFNEIRRVLKPNGIFYFSTPGAKAPDADENGDDPSHISCLTMPEWEALMINGRFKIVTDEYEPKWVNHPMFIGTDWRQKVCRKVA